MSRITRSQIPTDERERLREEEKASKIKISDLSILEYPKGKINYSMTIEEIGYACDNMIRLTSKELVLGFDLEWPFDFKTGPGATAVMQICADLKLCYVFHLSALKNKLPIILKELLEHPNVRLTGVNIKNDIHKLSRDFKSIDSSKLLNNCIELGAISTHRDKIRVSMSELVNFYMKKKINKDKRVRMSKWHVVPLSEAQVKYAAIDAFASLELYNIITTITEPEMEAVRKLYFLD